VGGGRGGNSEGQGRGVVFGRGQRAPSPAARVGGCKLPRKAMAEIDLGTFSTL